MNYNKKIHNRELAKLIQKKSPRFFVKDIQEVLDAEQEVWQEELSKGHAIKYGKLYQFTPTEKKPRIHYDGIHKKMVNLPKRTVVKIEPLMNIKNLF